MSRAAVLVAHGAPSDPGPQEAAMAGLAARVAAALPGWDIRSATLAAPGALEAACAGLVQPLIYPFFMAEGWFTGTELPRRLAAAGQGAARRLAPFGSDPGLAALALAAAEDGARRAGLAAGQTTLLLAAHGSGRVGAGARASRLAAEALARQLVRGPFRSVGIGLIEEPPFIADAARAAALAGPVLCLPLFALAAGHVTGDLPQALAQAAFPGPLLPPIGAHPAAAALIAEALARAG